MPRKKKEEELELEELEEDDTSDDSDEDTLDFEDEKDDDLFSDGLGMDDWGMGGQVTPLEKHSDLLKQLTDFSEYHKDLLNGWLGLTWNEAEEKFSKTTGIQPIMNAKCAAWCIGFLKTYTRKNNIITHIGKNEYIYIVHDIIDTIWLNIPLRTEEFEINSMGDVYRICTELEHAAELILMGAGDGKYNKLLSETTQRTESLQIQPRQMMNQNQMAMMPPKMGYMDRGVNWLKGK